MSIRSIKRSMARKAMADRGFHGVHKGDRHGGSFFSRNWKQFFEKAAEEYRGKSHNTKGPKRRRTEIKVKTD